MDDEYGNVMPALQLAQVGEQRADLAAGVFVDAVKIICEIEGGRIIDSREGDRCLFRDSGPLQPVKR